MLRGKHILKKSLKLQDMGLNSLVTVNLEDPVYEIKNIMEYNKLSFIKIFNSHGGKSLIGYEEVKDYCKIQDWILEETENKSLSNKYEK